MKNKKLAWLLIIFVSCLNNSCNTKNQDKILGVFELGEPIPLDSLSTEKFEHSYCAIKNTIVGGDTIPATVKYKYTFSKNINFRLIFDTIENGKLVGLSLFFIEKNGSNETSILDEDVFHNLKNIFISKYGNNYRLDTIDSRNSSNSLMDEYGINYTNTQDLGLLGIDDFPYSYLDFHQNDSEYTKVGYESLTWLKNKSRIKMWFAKARVNVKYNNDGFELPTNYNYIGGVDYELTDTEKQRLIEEAKKEILKRDKNNL